MKTSRLLMLCLAAWALSHDMVRADDNKADEAKNALREKLDTAIPEGIRLLETKDYAGFLRNFIPPDILKQINSNNELEDFAKKWGEKKADVMLKVLKSIKDEKPKLEDDGKKATYDVKVEDAPLKSITFVKVDKFWYIER